MSDAILGGGLHGFLERFADADLVEIIAMLREPALV